MAEPATIFAHSSGRPPAAIAVIRISGPAAQDAAARLAGPLPRPRYASLRDLRDEKGGLLDQALVLRFAAPASATGEDLVELHCHGGRAVVAAVLAALAEMPGLRAAEPGEFTRRALSNGRIDLTEAEGLADLLEAETELQRRSALASAGGGVRRLVEEWRRAVIDLSAQVEAAIDYVGDEDETALDPMALRAEIDRLADEWREWLDRPRTDLLRQGVRVVLAGPPNAGKSSLLNALAGSDKAIVTDVAGTTRDSIEVPLAVDGVPLTLIDTAGLRDSSDTVERIGISRAQAEVARADILLWLGDEQDAPRGRDVIRVWSQSDRRGPVPEAWLAVSAVSGEGRAALLTRIAELARSLLPSTAEVALNARQAELVSQALTALAQPSGDILILAEQLREAREQLDRISGINGTEEMLDALFGRFCLGK